MPTRYERKHLKKKSVANPTENQNEEEPKLKPRYIHEGTGKVTNEKPEKKGLFGRKKEKKD